MSLHTLSSDKQGTLLHCPFHSVFQRQLQFELCAVQAFIFKVFITFSKRSDLFSVHSPVGKTVALYSGIYGIREENEVSNLSVIYCLKELRKTTIDSRQDSLRPFVIQRGISPNTCHVDKTCFRTDVRMMKNAQWHVPGH